MFDTDPSGWSRSTWWLYALAAYYVGGFLLFWFRFRAAERRAKRGGVADVLSYNRLLRGFPNAVYAKMFGRRPFEVPNPEPAPPQAGA